MGVLGYNHTPAVGEPGNLAPLLDRNATCSSVALDRVLVSHVIGKICLLGLLGNVLNLIVLTRKRLTTNMERLERGAHFGLVALAVSDLLFCVSAYPHCWESTDEWQEYTSINFWLVYQVYGSACINVFILSSTWLTVAMAVSRYLAICHPLHSVHYLGLTAARRATALIFLLTVTFNIPRFFLYKIESWQPSNQTMVYVRDVGPFWYWETTTSVYNWTYFLLGILIPLFVLAFCNFHLVRALKQSQRMRRQQHGGASGSDAPHVLTLTLSVIVLFYILFVVPNEALNFVKDVMLDGKGEFVIFNLVVTICNTLQAINFAFNFVLYCLINANFRRTIHDLVCGLGLCCKKTNRQYSSVNRSSRMTTLKT